MQQVWRARMAPRVPTAFGTPAVTRMGLQVAAQMQKSPQLLRFFAFVPNLSWQTIGFHHKCS